MPISWNLSFGQLRTCCGLGVFGSKRITHIWSLDDIFPISMLEQMGDRTFLMEFRSASSFPLVGDDPIKSVYLMGVVLSTLSNGCRSTQWGKKTFRS